MIEMDDEGDDMMEGDEEDMMGEEGMEDEEMMSEMDGFMEEEEEMIDGNGGVNVFLRRQRVPGDDGFGFNGGREGIRQNGFNEGQMTNLEIQVQKILNNLRRSTHNKFDVRGRYRSTKPDENFA